MNTYDLATKDANGMLTFDAEGEWRLSQKEAERFAALVAAKEREDGAASAMAGEPMAWMTFTEEGDPDMVFLDRLEACQYCEDDDPPKPLYLAAPPTAQVLGCGAEPPGIQALMCVISSLRDIAHFSDEEGGELMSALCALRDWAYAQTAAFQPPPTSAKGVEHG